MSELLADEVCGTRGQLAVRGRVEPSARAGWMWQGDDHGAVELVPSPNALREPGDAEESSDRKAPDGNDQPRSKDPQLQSRQNSQSSCSRGVGVRSPRPDGDRPG